MFLSTLIRTLALASILGVVTNAFGAPRTNQVLIDIAYETVCLSHHDGALSKQVVAVVGMPASKLTGTALMSAIATLPSQTLEQIRNALTAEHRRKLIGSNLHSFFNPDNTNSKHGTMYYASKLEELCKGDAEFYKKHKAFCDTLNANANTTSVIAFGKTLKQSYEKADKDTKKAIKPVLEKVNQKNRFTLYGIVSSRLANNGIA